MRRIKSISVAAMNEIMYLRYKFIENGHRWIHSLLWDDVQELAYECGLNADDIIELIEMPKKEFDKATAIKELKKTKAKEVKKTKTKAKKNKVTQMLDNVDRVNSQLDAFGSHHTLEDSPWAETGTFSKYAWDVATKQAKKQTKRLGKSKPKSKLKKPEKTINGKDIKAVWANRALDL